MGKNEGSKKFNLKTLTNSLRNTGERDFYEDDEYSEYEYEEQEVDGASVNNKINMRKLKSPDKNLFVFVPKNKEQDVSKIITQLREGSPCIINVSELPDEDAKRVIDHISGAAFALNGSGVPVAKGIFAFTPKSFIINDTNSDEINEKDMLLSNRPK